MAAEMHFIQTIIGVGILLAAAKLMAELFSRIKLPIVLGELLAGMIVGPFALGMFFIYDGKPLLQIDANLQLLGEIGAIVILFMAGLEMTPREFLRGGKSSFTVGTLGVVIPFAAGYFVFQFFGFDALQSMLIATALTATSIAISIQVLNEFGKIKTPEARMIIGAAVVDDILAIAVLSVVSSIAADGGWNYQLCILFHVSTSNMSMVMPEPAIIEYYETRSPDQLSLSCLALPCEQNFGAAILYSGLSTHLLDNVRFGMARLCFDLNFKRLA